MLPLGKKEQAGILDAVHYHQQDQWTGVWQSSLFCVRHFKLVSCFDIVPESSKMIYQTASEKSEVNAGFHWMRVEHKWMYFSLNTCPSEFKALSLENIIPFTWFLFF
jgi:hypothetical protein